MPGWLRRLRARIKYRHFERDVAREIEAHRALKAAEHRERGLAAEQAGAAAARDLGNVTLMREDARGVWLAPWLQSVWQDLRYAVVSYRRQPLFTIGALLILSLGTGLVTVAFSLAHAAFLRPWRVADPSSVAILRTTPATSQLRDFRGISIAEFRYLRERARTIDVIYTMRSVMLDLSEGDRALGRASSIFISDNYLTALRIPILAGRGFSAAENDYQTPAPVAVISERLWRDLFNREPSVIGRTIRAGRRHVTIIGVAGADSFVDSAASGYDLALPLTASAQTSTPEALAPFSDPRRASSTGSAAGRLAAGAERQTNHHFATTGQTPGEQHVADVGARQRQHEHQCQQDQLRRPPHVVPRASIHGRRAERDDVDGRERGRAPKLPAQRRQLGRRRGHRGAGGESSGR